MRRIAYLFAATIRLKKQTPAGGDCGRCTFRGEELKGCVYTKVGDPCICTMGKAKALQSHFTTN